MIMMLYTRDGVENADTPGAGGRPSRKRHGLSSASASE